MSGWRLVPVAVLTGFGANLLLTGPRDPGGTRAACVLLAIVLAEIAVFVALGGAGLLLGRWEICPRCADFRLSDHRYRRLLRIERVFRPLLWYLGLPAAFLVVLWVAGFGDPWLAVALWIGAAPVMTLSSIRPRRALPSGERWGARQIGDRIPEDEDSA